MRRIKSFRVKGKAIGKEISKGKERVWLWAAWDLAEKQAIAIHVSEGRSCFDASSVKSLQNWAEAFTGFTNYWIKEVLRALLMVSSSASNPHCRS